LRGIVGATRTNGTIKITEADCHRMQQGRRWQEDYIVKAL
jgi:hypothetical protein